MSNKSSLNNKSLFNNNSSSWYFLNKSSSWLDIDIDIDYQRYYNVANQFTILKNRNPTPLPTMTSTFTEEINNSIALRPSSYRMSDLKWKFAVRAVLRGKNILVTGLQGCGKTVLAYTLKDALNRPFFNIPLGLSQDPRSTLIGNTHFEVNKGTILKQSYFVQAIQIPNAIILLDEISRAHPEAWNILMPVLDYKQRFLRIDEDPETPTIKVADGVTFIATANIGHSFTSTRTLDAALLDRFTTIEVEPLSKNEEKELLLNKFPTLDGNLLHALTSITEDSRKLYNTSDKLSNIISTRMLIEIVELLVDGFTLNEAAEVAIYPLFSSENGEESERSVVKKIIQKYSAPATTVKSPFDLDNDEKLTPIFGEL